MFADNSSTEDDFENEDASEEDSEDTACRVCGGTDSEPRFMLLCSTCDAGYHGACLKPPLRREPPEDEDWHCPQCLQTVRAPGSLFGRCARIRYNWPEHGGWHAGEVQGVEYVRDETGALVPQHSVEYAPDDVQSHPQLQAKLDEGKLARLLERDVAATEAARRDDPLYAHGAKVEVYHPARGGIESGWYAGRVADVAVELAVPRAGSSSSSSSAAASVLLHLVEYKAGDRHWEHLCDKCSKGAGAKCTSRSADEQRLIKGQVQHRRYRRLDQRKTVDTTGLAGKQAAVLRKAQEAELRKRKAKWAEVEGDGEAGGESPEESEAAKRKKAMERAAEDRRERLEREAQQEEEEEAQREAKTARFKEALEAGLENRDHADACARVAKQISAELSHLEQNKQNKQARALLANLPKKDNVLLRARLLSNDLGVPELVRMNSEQLAPPELQEKRAAGREAAKRAVIVDEAVCGRLPALQLARDEGGASPLSSPPLASCSPSQPGPSRERAEAAGPSAPPPSLPAVIDLSEGGAGLALTLAECTRLKAKLTMFASQKRHADLVRLLKALTAADVMGDDQDGVSKLQNVKDSEIGKSIRKLSKWTGSTADDEVASQAGACKDAWTAAAQQAAQAE